MFILKNWKNLLYCYFSKLVLSKIFRMPSKNQLLKYQKRENSTNRFITLTPNPITFTLTTLDHRITTLQHRHEHDFSMLTKQTGLTDMKSETPSVHQLICDHIDAFIQKQSSVVQIKPIRHYSEFVERYIKEFIDP